MPRPPAPHRGPLPRSGAHRAPAPPREAVRQPAPPCTRTSKRTSTEPAIVLLRSPARRHVAPRRPRPRRRSELPSSPWWRTHGPAPTRGQGPAQVSAAMRRAATVADFSSDTRKTVDTCADYLLSARRRPTAVLSRPRGAVAALHPHMRLEHGVPGHDQRRRAELPGRPPDHHARLDLSAGWNRASLRQARSRRPARSLGRRGERPVHPSDLRPTV